ncbi:MAG: hypothetical protein ACI9Y1_000710 [Lentisphaeria bacterium]|jgi:hypothetical protein
MDHRKSLPRIFTTIALIVSVCFGFSPAWAQQEGSPIIDVMQTNATTLEFFVYNRSTAKLSYRVNGEELHIVKMAPGEGFLSYTLEGLPLGALVDYRVTTLDKSCNCLGTTPISSIQMVGDINPTPTPTPAPTQEPTPTPWPTPTPDPTGLIDLPVTFEETGIDYSLISFGGSTFVSLTPDPDDSFNTVAMINKDDGAVSWAGVIIGDPVTWTLAKPIELSDSRSIITVRFNSPDAGTPVLLKIEQFGNSDLFAEVLVNTTVAGWETLSFDFSAATGGSFDPSTVAYDVLVIFPNFGFDGDSAKTYYFDDVLLADDTNTPAPDNNLEIYTNSIQSPWVDFLCCGFDETFTEVEDEDTSNTVAEFSIAGSAGSVNGFSLDDGTAPLNLGEFSGGTFEFDLKVVTDTTGDWIFKLEGTGGFESGGTGDLLLSESNEGVDPVTGEWQHYTYNIDDLVAEGWDITDLTTILWFPTWGQGAGAVYRIDNVFFSK